MHDILKKIHEYPFDMICPCSLTPMWEIICAILKGAHTYADLTVATGVRSGCSIYCITNTLAAFEACAHDPHINLKKAQDRIWDEEKFEQAWSEFIASQEAMKK